MKCYLSLFFILLSFSKLSLAKPKITVTIAPLASITALLTSDKADISIINSSLGCPHHYQLKPTDREKIVTAELLIYVDEHFDHYAEYFKNLRSEKLIKISQFDVVNFQDQQQRNNWHFWLDIDNIIKLLPELALMLKVKIPILLHEVERNLPIILTKLQKLKTLKQQELVNLAQLVIFSQSIEHFLLDLPGSHVRIYQKNYPSLNDLVRIKTILTSNPNQCLLVDYSQNPELYQKLGPKLIKLNAENWPLKNSNLKNSFFVEYKKMINTLKTCQIQK